MLPDDDYFGVVTVDDDGGYGWGVAGELALPFSMSVMEEAVVRSDDGEKMMIGGIGDPWI